MAKALWATVVDETSIEAKSKLLVLLAPYQNQLFKEVIRLPTMERNGGDSSKKDGVVIFGISADNCEVPYRVGEELQRLRNVAGDDLLRMLQEDRWPIQISNIQLCIS